MYIRVAYYGNDNSAVSGHRRDENSLCSYKEEAVAPCPKFRSF